MKSKLADILSITDYGKTTATLRKLAGISSLERLSFHLQSIKNISFRTLCLPFVLVIIFDFYVYHALDSSFLPDRVNMSNMETCEFEAESEFLTLVRNPLSDTSPSTETFN